MSRGRLATLLAATVVVAGCGIARVERAPVDDLSTWSRVPLRGEQGLATRAAQGPSSCKAAADDQPVTLLIQDRRTDWTAAFLFTSGAQFGSCFVSTAEGGTGGGSGPQPEAMTGPLTIDDDSSGMVAAGQARDLGGRLAAPVVSVLVELEGGQTVVASVGNGYWLAWWPLDARPTSVVGLDASSAEVERVAVKDPGAKQ